MNCSGSLLEDLTITEESGSTVVHYNSEGLAVVSGVVPSLLTAEDFLTPESQTMFG